MQPSTENNPNYSGKIILFLLSYFVGIKYLLSGYSFYNLYNNNKSAKNMYLTAITTSWVLFGFWTTLLNISVVGVYELIKNFDKLPKMQFNLPESVNNYYLNLISKVNTYKSIINSNPTFEKLTTLLFNLFSAMNDKFNIGSLLLLEKVQPLLEKSQYYNQIVSFFQESKETTETTSSSKINNNLLSRYSKSIKDRRRRRKKNTKKFPV